MIERNGIIQFKESDVSVVGMNLEAGTDAPEFRVINQDWQEVYGLKETAGKIRILLALPSLETSICERETLRFNQEAVKLGNEIAILAISTDLPFTQAHRCASKGIEQVRVLSDHKFLDFGVKYSCLLSEPRILRRAVFIVDRQNILQYVSYMNSLNSEPDYELVLRTAKALLKE